MAFQKPVENQQPTNVIAPEVMAQVAKILSHNHVGQWSSDHIQESKSFTGWNYLAIAAIGREAARAHAYVYLDSDGRAAQDGTAKIAGPDSITGRLVIRPNVSQSGALFQWEYIQQMHLHGCCLIVNRPSVDGSRTVARYILPMALTQPVYPGQDKNCPRGGVRIMPYEAGLGWYVNPLIGSLAGATLPIEMISIVRYPHPAFRGDGQSPTDAAGWWVDTATMVDMTRWKQLRRGPRPYGIVSVKGDAVTETELDSIEKRINRKLGDEQYDERAMAIGADVDMSQDTSPVDMDYVQSFDQVGQAILAIHGIGKAFVGLSENQTYGGNAAAQQKALTVVQSDLDLLAGEWSQLAQDEGEQVTVCYEVQPLDDPTLLEQQMGQDLQAGMLLGKEWRAKRGLKPFGDWRDEARVTSSGLVDDRVKPADKAAPQPTDPTDPGTPQPTDPFAKSMLKRVASMAKALSVQRLERPPIVAIDLDSTLARHDGSFDPSYIGPAIPEQVAMVRQLRDAGCQIVIFTCRDDDEVTAQWLRDNDVPYDAINCNPDGSTGSGKVFADVYYDDKAVNTKEGIAAIADMLPSGPAKDRLSRQPVEVKLGCIMLEARPQVAELVKLYQLEQISPVTLLDDGYEEWPHVTVLYGIVGTPIDEVVAMVRKMVQVDAVFGRMSTFDNPAGSILKVEVDSPVLCKWNQRLKDALPLQETFPDYQPHMTIAKMDPEAADSHRGPCELTGMATTFTHAVVSVGGQKVRVPLVAPAEPINASPIEYTAGVIAKPNPTMFADNGEIQTATMLKALEQATAGLNEKIEAMAKSMSHSLVEENRSLAKAKQGQTQHEDEQSIAPDSQSKEG